MYVHGTVLHIVNSVTDGLMAPTGFLTWLASFSNVCCLYVSSSFSPRACHIPSTLSFTVSMLEMSLLTVAMVLRNSGLNWILLRLWRSCDGQVTRCIQETELLFVGYECVCIEVSSASTDCVCVCRVFVQVPLCLPT